MKYSQEITDEVCKYLRAGNSQRDSAILSGISEETFYDWQRPESDQFHAEFSESIKRAEQECKARNIALIQKAAEKSWQAAAWYLERRYNKDFGIRQITELQGKDGDAINLFINAGSGFIPANVKLSTSSAGGSYGSAQVQGSGVAQTSPKDDNSDNGVSETSTP